MAVTRRRTPTPPARDLTHLVTDTTRAGEVVRLRGEHGRWRMSAEVLNVNTGAAWVELYGPLSDADRVLHGFRAVRPEEVRAL